jgi:hypothetical protein
MWAMLKTGTIYTSESNFEENKIKNLLSSVDGIDY